MIAGLHDVVEIKHMVEVGGPTVLVFAAIGGAIGAYDVPPEDRAERAMSGGLIGALVGVLFGSAIIAALV